MIALNFDVLGGNNYSHTQAPGCYAILIDVSMGNGENPSDAITPSNVRSLLI